MFDVMFNDLCKSRHGLNVKDIKLVSDELMRLPVEKILDFFEIEYDEVVCFNSNADDSYGSSDIMGFTTFVISVGQIYPVVFIRDNFVDGKKDFSIMLNYIFLQHELGHVDDFYNGKSYDLVNRRVEIIEAEAYADIFAMKKLKSRYKVSNLDKIALAYYAKNVIGNSRKNDFYEKVFALINKKIIASKIREWARYI